MTISAEEIAVAYFNASAGASGLRLTLHTDAQARLEKWLDLGGRWMTLANGRFLLVGDTVLTTFRDIDWCATSFAVDGVLHVRQIPLRRVYDVPDVSPRFVLAPTDTIAELDAVIQENPPGLDRLEENFLALRLFIQQIC